MIEFTYWENGGGENRTEDDFDGILTIRLKTVKQIPELITHMPKNCTMISTERSAVVLKRDKSGPTNPDNPKHFKELWRKGQPIPQQIKKCCPLCGKE